MIPGLKSRKIGASGRTYSAQGQGFSIKATTEEHGYVVKLQVLFNYNAMTDRQSQRAHNLLYAAITEVLAASSNGRKINVPLIALEDLQMKPGEGEGINTR